jgi:hypothetical protein
MRRLNRVDALFREAGQGSDGARDYWAVEVAAVPIAVRGGVLSLAGWLRVGCRLLLG